MITIDTRPRDCRFRLSDDGKAFPKSGCTACGATIATLGNECKRGKVEEVKMMHRHSAEAAPIRTLIDRILGAYHTGRLSETPAAEHIMAKLGETLPLMVAMAHEAYLQPDLGSPPNDAIAILDANLPEIQEEIKHDVYTKRRAEVRSAELEEVVRRARFFAVAFLAFSGRDQGTDRWKQTFEDFVAEAIALDNLTAAVLRKKDG